MAKRKRPHRQKSKCMYYGCLEKPAFDMLCKQHKEERDEAAASFWEGRQLSKELEIACLFNTLSAPSNIKTKFS